MRKHYPILGRLVILTAALLVLCPRVYADQVKQLVLQWSLDQAQDLYTPATPICDNKVVHYEEVLISYDQIYEGIR